MRGSVWSAVSRAFLGSLCPYVCVEVVSVGVRGHKHRASSASIALLTYVTFIPSSLSACVFPLRRYLTVSLRPSP